MPREIGDIFISIDHAKMQAEEYGHSFYREMCFLFKKNIINLILKNKYLSQICKYIIFNVITDGYQKKILNM